MIGDITIGEYPLYFLPLEKDLLSLELDSSFQELYMVCDASIFSWLSLELIVVYSTKTTTPFSTPQGLSWIYSRSMVYFHV